MVESNGGEVFDVGGLRGTGAGTAALAGRIWHDLDSDAIHFTDDATFTTRVRNAVRLDGAIQAPDAFAADLLDGLRRHLSPAAGAPRRRCSARRPAGGLRRHAGPRAAAADDAVRLAHLSPQPAALPEGRLPLEHGVRRAEPLRQRIARRARGVAGAGQRAQGARGARRAALRRARRRHGRPRRQAHADRAAATRDPGLAAVQRPHRGAVAGRSAGPAGAHQPGAVGDHPHPLLDRARARRPHRARRHVARFPRRPRPVDRPRAGRARPRHAARHRLRRLGADGRDRAAPAPPL